MADTHPSSCRSCGAGVLWAITDKGKRMPLDVTPTPGGNIRLDLHHAHVIGKDEVYNGPRYTSHFATCPNASAHRKRK